MAIVATHVAAVQQLYVAYFGRPADVAGLDYWTNVVEAQAGSTTAVSASFATQPEYIAAFFGKTNTQVIDQIYANMFARGASTTDGRSYWLDLLNKGSVSINTIVDEVAKGAKGTDLTAVENKVEAASAFTAALDTEAEQAGYNGTDALTLAKAWITSITTNATLTAAITPAALNAQVAAVVKAGTPFALDTALSQLQTAERALDKFLDANDLPATAAAAKLEVTADLGTATSKVAALVTGGYDPVASTAIAAARLGDQQKANTAALKTETDELAALNAEAAGKTGLSAAIANVRTADTVNEAAIETAEDTQLDLNVARGAFDTRNDTTVAIATLVVAGKPTVPAAGTAVVTIPGDAAAVPPVAAVDLIVVNARGNFVLASGVTEADHPGVTALRDALTADFYADSDAFAAAATLKSAEEVKVVVDNAPLVADVLQAYADVKTAQDKIDALAKAVADRAEVVALQTELNAVSKVVTDLQADFAANGFATPAPLDSATAAGTAASDIFMLGDAENVSITGFGRLGEDSLYVGTNYVLNSGELSSGNNSAMEIFFVQNGNRAEVHVETAAYGSSSDDVIVVSLVGVDVADLQLVDGIISLKAGA